MSTLLQSEHRSSDNCRTVFHTHSQPLDTSTSSFIQAVLRPSTPPVLQGSFLLSMKMTLHISNMLHGRRVLGNSEKLMNIKCLLRQMSWLHAVSQKKHHVMIVLDLDV